MDRIIYRYGQCLYRLNSFLPVSEAVLTPVDADSAAVFTPDETLCLILLNDLGSKTEALLPALASRTDLYVLSSIPYLLL